ncbi:MAG: chemotaxis protein CheW [Bacteriovoracaceae bacterium]
MANVSLNELFVKFDGQSPLDDQEEKVINLYFTYATKNYCTDIQHVKEIIEFPLFIPYPVDLGATLGLFNLRGNIVPILDPDRYFLNLQSIHRSKVPQIFRQMKLRLIVFELENGVHVAIPASDVGKTEITLEESKSESGFARINDIPHEKFDIKKLVEENI